MGLLATTSRSLTQGFTLVELITILILLGLALSGAVPLLKAQMDRVAVLAAREEVMGLFHRARSEAVARGGVTLWLTSHPPTARLVWGEEVLASADLRGQYGVGLDLSRGRAEVGLTFDPLGLGRIASQTLRLSRGRAEASLVVSSYGRVARR